MRHDSFAYRQVNGDQQELEGKQQEAHSKEEEDSMVPVVRIDKQQRNRFRQAIASKNDDCGALPRSLCC